MFLRLFCDLGVCAVHGDCFSFQPNLADELLRPGYAGICGGLATGVAYGIPPVAMYASDAIKNRVVPQVLLGDEQMALAITEPHAGSDVQGILTTGKLSDDGKNWVINGEKKWITNGSVFWR